MTQTRPILLRKAETIIPLLIFVYAFIPHPVTAAALPVTADNVGGDSIVNFGRRFSFHTNVIDLALSIINVGIEFDLSPRPTSRYSLGVHTTYRPSTWHKYHPSVMLNLASVRGEFRRYWRTFNDEEYLAGIERDSTRFWLLSKLSYFRRRRLSGIVASPAHYWRAYYVGLFVEADKFTYRITGDGRQGSGFMVGLSYGWTLPIYPLRNGRSIDLDLGFAIGARMEQYDRFSYVTESHCYSYLGSQSRHLLKHPVLADAHVSLVYRFNSINNKVKGNHERFHIREDSIRHRISVRDKRISDKRINKENAWYNDSVHFDSIQKAIDRERMTIDSIPRKERSAFKKWQKIVASSNKEKEKTTNKSRSKPKSEGRKGGNDED